MKRAFPRYWTVEARRKGVALMITAICLVLMVPVMGLAIDATILYGIRAKLTTASDAAALSAARSLAVGSTLAAQTANATATATNFFNANFPDGYFSTTGKTVNVTIAESVLKVRSVTINSEVKAPSLFMRFLSSSLTTIRATARAERRDTNVVMVLDRSGSMDGNGGCPAMKAAAAAFAMKFANNRDRVGMVTFGSDNRVDFALQNPPGDFQNGAGGIPALAAAINCDGGTGTASAMWRAYEELVRINEPGALNVVMLMTDGQPNTLNLNLSAPIDAFGYNAIRWNLPLPAPQKYTTPAGGAFDPASSRSSCANTANKNGIVTPFGSPLFGIFAPLAPPLPVPDGYGQTNLAAGATAGCTFETVPTEVHKDIAFLPEVDAHGTSLVDEGYLHVERWPGGHPDAGRIKSDDYQTFMNASYNAVQNSAIRMRNNATAFSDLNVVVYAIGLGAGVTPEASTLLQRAANVSTSPIYNPMHPEGMYVWAPDAAALDQAFSSIASDMLRLAR